MPNGGATQHPELIERLRRLELLARVDDAAVERLAAECEQVRFEAGDWIIRQGTRSGGLYILIDGEAAAVVDGSDRGRLGPGAFFGEISVLLDEPATAGVAARTNLVCLLVPAGAVERLLAENGGLTLAMLRTEARRLQTANQWRV